MIAWVHLTTSWVLRHRDTCKREDRVKMLVVHLSKDPSVPTKTNSMRVFTRDVKRMEVTVRREGLELATKLEIHQSHIHPILITS
jgi:hypothetical protein